MAREINLVPDIKEEMIKALKLRNFIFFVCIIVASASVGVILLFATIAGGQQAIADGNKAKIEFVLEKLRQYMNMSGDKISVEEIKSFGCFMSHEYDKLIEQLNVQGLLMKTGSREYQILLD